ncbi:2-oxoglutarate and iron-dependent oxygenase domain-containing protein 3 [Orchesella cincta]|uniref:2-oxoglutarate and iron-dependent oxygenase domain-containing protein 3 n=1 Tax=Orchesella cincta TaxID=48709 RepID=A0A1D2MK07_ORCCI|nr:2-oxoglutarate and iron-dependent oxygenase domain-containing protein 3 [Orchesella cincta]
MSSEVTQRKGDAVSKSTKEEPKETSGSPSKTKKDKDQAEDAPPKPKFGPMPRFSKQRLWSRGILITGLLVIVWYNSGKKNEQSFADFDEEITAKAMKTRCSSSHEAAVKPFSKCIPKQCGRFVVDNLFSPQEIYALKDLMERVFKEGKVEGAASVFDFQLGLMQLEGETVDLYKLNSTRKIFQKGDQIIYQNLKGKLQRLISSYFAIDHWSLHTAAPMFMTRLNRKFAKRESDEYWHPAVHQKQFKTYQYSTVLFMSDYGTDIEGGRLIFIDGDNTNRTVDPKLGRAIAFSSGEESLHYTERVRKGTRFAVTVGFTCNPNDAVLDPKL